MVSDWQQPGSQRVLIVDQSEDSREVLRTVLERRGVEIYEASERLVGLDLAKKCCPDLMVLDVETASPDGSSSCEGFNDQASTHLVLLGSVSPAAGNHRTQVVAKPYHYGPLIRKIEELLDQRSHPPSSE